MDQQTLIASMEFARARLLGILDGIEKSGQDVGKVLAWRPAPGRAHIAWQAMHCAATHDRYLNVNLKKGEPKDAQLVANFAGGSTPSDTNVPSLAEIREKLAVHYKNFVDFVATQTTEELDRKAVGKDGKERSLGDIIVLFAWHEAHHQGQIHLTWNMYKAAHGVK